MSTEKESDKEKLSEKESVLLPLYRDRPEWKDVTPIYNSEDEEAVVHIESTEEFIDAFAYFRAILNANEMSERAFELTETCAILNAANYSVWQYRRTILEALNKSISDELIFSDHSINQNPKNYQVWHHRKFLIEKCGDHSMELKFTANFLEEDQKNYHAWQYRQWLVEHFNLHSQMEIAFSADLIAQDVRNNSAWNYRYFILTTLSNGFEDAALVEAEVRFTLNCIRLVQNNECAWSYLSGILVRDGLTARKDVKEFCEELLAQNPPSKSVFLRNFVIDCLMEELEKPENQTTEAAEQYMKSIHVLLNELERLDPIRTKYWRHRRLFATKLLESFS